MKRSLECVVCDTVVIAKNSHFIPPLRFVIVRAPRGEACNVTLNLGVEAMVKLKYDVHTFFVPSEIDQLLELVDIIIDCVRPLVLLRSFEMHPCSLNFIFQTEELNEFFLKGGPCSIGKGAILMSMMHSVIGEVCSMVSFHVG